jgi:hypothetical protein
MAADRCGSPFGAFARFTDRKQLCKAKVKERKTVTYHHSFDSRIKKYIAAEKPKIIFNEAHKRSGGDLITIVTANEACNGR